MIVFDLRCPTGHVFEAWFGSTGAYEQQRNAGLIGCPACGDTDIEKAVMAPAIAAKGHRSSVAPQAMKQAMQMLAAEQAKLLDKSTWVGAGFAHRARAMHAGEESPSLIHGQATVAEAKALIDDGVPVAPLPLPIVPPDQVN
ncbi:DUF1178 family protein [Sphingomonas mollis]|uniref:DUF1178 family protein n=1 Tax=Sphingomonas mollis TaxID=2795726 RepID=A0ABS0XT35_9SPHN|nr:DUF1178 family protein [Sphingomonas sp. BT553]MBJ6123219.1 DUF1178 family protein [Sphingomonas sp. BT553]